MKKKGLLALLVLAGIFVWIGLRGIEFGDQADENKAMRPFIVYALENNLLPRHYAYPTVYLHLSFAALTGDAVALLFRSSNDRFLHQLAEISASHSFLIRMRIVTLLLSTLSLVAVYFAVLVWRKNQWEAWLAAALMGTSWEVGYHCRWFSVDPLLMLAGAVLIFTLAKSRGLESDKWLWLSTVTAALGFSSKYPGGALLIPVMLSLILSSAPLKKKDVLKKLLAHGALFLFVFILCTPGFVIEPKKFFANAYEMAQIYAAGTRLQQQPYFLEAGLPYFLTIVEYFSLAVFSKYRWVALIWIIFSFMGIIDLIRRERKFALVFLSFPVFFIFYFSLQRVLYVRNLLVLIPFFTVLSARGFQVFFTIARKIKIMRLAAILFAVVSLSINAGWAWRAADSIQQRETLDKSDLLMKHVDAHPQRLFILSPSLRNMIKGPVNVVSNPPPGSTKNTYAVFTSTDLKWNELKANHSHTYETWFGPAEINPNYYPTAHVKNERWLVMPWDQAKHFSIFASAP